MVLSICYLLDILFPVFSSISYHFYADDTSFPFKRECLEAIDIQMADNSLQLNANKAEAYIIA